MELVYSQTTGIISRDGIQLGHGWAGQHDGKNNPAMQNIRGVGPLPQGWYTIDPWEDQHGHLGPMVAHLTPDASNEMFGRDAFYIHGPSLGANYGQESMGCIVLLRADRTTVKNSGETRLQVTE